MNNTDPRFPRNIHKHLVIAYEKHHALVPEGLKKLPGGTIEFVEHKVARLGDPVSPITSFLTHESDLFISNKCQLTHLQGCVKIAVHGGMSPEYLLGPIHRLQALKQSPLVHGFLLGLYKMYNDLMIVPEFGLMYSSIEEYVKSIAAYNPFYQDDMD